MNANPAGGADRGHTRSSSTRTRKPRSRQSRSAMGFRSLSKSDARSRRGLQRRASHKRPSASACHRAHGRRRQLRGNMSRRGSLDQGFRPNGPQSRGQRSLWVTYGARVVGVPVRYNVIRRHSPRGLADWESAHRRAVMLRRLAGVAGSVGQQMGVTRYLSDCAHTERHPGFNNTGHTDDGVTEAGIATAIRTCQRGAMVSAASAPFAC